MGLQPSSQGNKKLYIVSEKSNRNNCLRLGVVTGEALPEFPGWEKAFKFSFSFSSRKKPFPAVVTSEKILILSLALPESNKEQGSLK